jgi:hypothetical protein
MPTGILGKAQLTGSGANTLYTVPSSKVASLTINVLNTDSSLTSKVSLALAANAANVAMNEYIEYNANIPPNGILERTGIVIDATKSVVANSVSNTIVVMVYGYEESA